MCTVFTAKPGGIAESVLWKSGGTVTSNEPSVATNASLGDSPVRERSARTRASSYGFPPSSAFTEPRRRRRFP